MWLDSVTQLVLLIDCETETVHAYRSRKDMQVADQSEVLDCRDAVSGWRLKVDVVFYNSAKA